MSDNKNKCSSYLFNEYTIYRLMFFPRIFIMRQLIRLVNAFIDNDNQDPTRRLNHADFNCH
jgi:hypothetical protein